MERKNERQPNDISQSPTFQTAVETAERYKKQWGWRDDLEDAFGELSDAVLAVVHESSDYSQYGTNYALRDSDRKAWEQRLVENDAPYAILRGGHDTVVMVALVGRGEDQLPIASVIASTFEELEQYPILDEETYGELVFEYTADYLFAIANQYIIDVEPAIETPEAFTDTIMNGISLLSSDQQNHAIDRMQTDQSISDETIHAVLKASGYRLSKP